MTAESKGSAPGSTVGSEAAKDEQVTTASPGTEGVSAEPTSLDGVLSVVVVLTVGIAGWNWYRSCFHTEEPLTFIVTLAGVLLAIAQVNGIPGVIKAIRGRLDACSPWATLLVVGLLVAAFLHSFEVVRSTAGTRYREGSAMLREANQAAGAAAVLRHAIALDSANHAAHYELASAYERLGNLDAAIEHYAHALDSEEIRDDAMNNLAHLYIVEKERPDDAIALIAPALVARPDDGEPGGLHPRTRYSLEKNLGWAYYMVGALPDGRDHLETAGRLADRLNGSPDEELRVSGAFCLLAILELCEMGRLPRGAMAPELSVCADEPDGGADSPKSLAEVRGLYDLCLRYRNELDPVPATWVHSIRVALEKP